MSTQYLSGPKDLMTLMKNISLKLKIEEFDVIVEFSSNKPELAHSSDTS